MKNDLPVVKKPMKKRTLALVLACIMALALAVPAFAHGCHGGKKGQTKVTVCTVRNCGTAGRHTHNGVTYCGYAHASGVCDGKCLALCEVEDCGIAGRHTHDGVTYCGNHHEEGFCDSQCLALCPVEGCTTAGRHTHSGTAYCGNHHEAGFCTGTCSVSRTGSGHHGGHH